MSTDHAQVVELPADIFEEAAIAARKMESSDTGILSISRDGGEVAGGLVAELLAMLASDTAALALPAPQVLAARPNAGQHQCWTRILSKAVLKGSIRGTSEDVIGYNIWFKYGL